LELALESLQNKKKQIDAEIAEIYRELRGRSSQKGLAQTRPASAKVASPRKPARFSKEERLRRSRRMKAYWENWRKKKSRAK
jgi:hypothetical protein